MFACAVAGSVGADLFAIDGGEIDNGTANRTEEMKLGRDRLAGVLERFFQADLLVRVLLEELFELFALTEPNTNHVDINALLELGQRHVGRGFHRTGDSCVVDGIVDPAKLLDHGFMGRDDRLLISGVNFKGADVDVWILRLDFSGDVF